MSAVKRFLPGDRVRVTHPGHHKYGQIGLVLDVSRPWWLIVNFPDTAININSALLEAE